MGIIASLRIVMDDHAEVEDVADIIKNAAGLTSIVKTGCKDMAAHLYKKINFKDPTIPAASDDAAGGRI